jgi:hypothetical protein
MSPFKQGRLDPAVCHEAQGADLGQVVDGGFLFERRHLAGE